MQRSNERLPATSTSYHFIGSQSGGPPCDWLGLAPRATVWGAGPLFGNSLFGLCVRCPRDTSVGMRFPALARLGVNALRQSRGCRATLLGTSSSSLCFINSHPKAFPAPGWLGPVSSIMAVLLRRAAVGGTSIRHPFVNEHISCFAARIEAIVFLIGLRGRHRLVFAAGLLCNHPRGSHPWGPE